MAAGDVYDLSTPNDTGTEYASDDATLSRQAMGYRMYHAMATPQDHATIGAYRLAMPQMPPIQGGPAMPMPRAPNVAIPNAAGATPATLGAPPPTAPPVNVNVQLPPQPNYQAPAPMRPQAPLQTTPVQGQAPPLLPRQQPPAPIQVQPMPTRMPQVAAAPPGPPIPSAAGVPPQGPPNPLTGIADLRGMGAISRNQQERMAMAMGNPMWAGAPWGQGENMQANPLLGNAGMLGGGF